MVISKRFFLLSVIILFSAFSCRENKDSQRVVFTTGFFMNPDKPRFGIEIKNDTLFYCEEIISKPGYYKYYYCNDYESGKLKNFQKNIKQIFNVKIEQREIPDATFCQLNIIEGENNIIKKFYLEKLKSSQREVIDNLIELKKCALKEIDHHDFPEDLLRSELPTPPLPPAP